MPKLKTHKGARKRFKVTARKKILHSKSNKSHLLTTKETGRKKKLRKKAVISKADRKEVKKMLPYDF